MLTNSDLKQILDALARYGKKDSQLDAVPIDLEHPEGTFTINDYLSIVQDGKNKTIKIKNLEKVFLLTFLTDEDFREALKGRIPGEMLENASVTTEKLADGSITTIKLGDSSVTNAKLSDNAVTSSKLADNSVTTSKIVDESVTTSKLNINAVTTDKLANGSVTTDKIANGAVTSSKIADNSLSGANFGNNTIEGTKIKDNSIPGSKLADGAIESIDIKDGTLSGSKLADNSVTGAKLQDSVITGIKIADNSIPGSKIADSTIQNLNIANNSISGSKLVDNAITTDKIANGAINSAKLANDAITENKIVDNSVTTNKIADRAVTNSKLANNSVTSDKIADNSITSSMITDYAVTENKLDSGSVTASKIAPNAVTTTKLDDNVITSDKIVDGSVTEQKLADNSVTTDKIDTDAVTNVKIADNAVTESKIATNAVTTAKIVDSSVTTVKIADNTVTTVKLTDGAVTEDKLADGAVTTSKLADGLISEIQNITDATPTEGSVKPVQSGGVKAAIDNVAFSTNEKVKDIGIDDEPTAGSDNLVKSGGIVKKFYGYVDMTIEGEPLSLPSSPSVGGFNNATSATATGESSCAWNYGGYTRHVYINLINVKKEGYKYLKVVANTEKYTYLTFVKKAGVPSTNSNKSFDSLVSDGYLSSVHSDYNKVLIACPDNKTTNIEIPDDAVGVYIQYRSRRDSGSDPVSLRKPESINPIGLFVNGDITTIKETLDNLPDKTHLINPSEESLAFAKDVMQLKLKLEGVTANEVKVIETPITGSYVKGTDGTLGTITGYAYIEVALENVNYVRFLGGLFSSSAYTSGYAFGHYTNPSDESTWVTDKSSGFDTDGSEFETKEYVIEVPEGATHFRTTTAISRIPELEQNFYCYLQSGSPAASKDYVDSVKSELQENINEITGKEEKTYETENIINSTNFYLSSDQLIGCFYNVTDLNSTAFGYYNTYYYNIGSIGTKSNIIKNFYNNNYKSIVITTNSSWNCYITFLKKYKPSVNKTLEELFNEGYLCDVHSQNGKPIIILPNNSDVEVNIPEDCAYIFFTKVAHGVDSSSANRLPSKITLVKHEHIDGTIDEINDRISILEDKVESVDELTNTVYGEYVEETENVNLSDIEQERISLDRDVIYNFGNSDRPQRVYVIPLYGWDKVTITPSRYVSYFGIFKKKIPVIYSIDSSTIQSEYKSTGCIGYTPQSGSVYRVVQYPESSSSSPKGSVEITLSDNANYLYIQKNFSDASQNYSPSSVVLYRKRREGGLVDKSTSSVVSTANVLSIEHGTLDIEGKVVEDNTKLVTGFIPHGGGFYVELQNGYRIDKAMLYDTQGNLVNNLYYSRRSAFTTFYGNAKMLPQFMVKLVISKSDDSIINTVDVVRKYFTLSDSRFSRTIPSGVRYKEMIYRLNQLENAVWNNSTKLQYTTPSYYEPAVWVGIPYSEAGEYTKYVGMHVSLKTYLTAVLNKRSVLYTENIQANSNTSKYGLTYRGLGGLCGTYYGTVCSGLTAYVHGDKDITFANSTTGDKIAKGERGDDGVTTIQIKDNGVWRNSTIDELFNLIEPLDYIWNTGHITIVSDVYKDIYGDKQFFVWSEQTTPMSFSTPFTKEMFFNRLNNIVNSTSSGNYKEWAIYRKNDWINQPNMPEEISDEYIQKDFFDYPKGLEIDPDISTFAGEYAAFSINSDIDNTNAYNNNKVFLNIHRNGDSYDTLQIFNENDDEAVATPITVDISSNDGTFIYNSNNIYDDDSLDKQDWIIVDLTQLQTPLIHGKYKARVINSSNLNVVSGFTHFQMVDISFSAVKGSNDIELIFNSNEGTPYLIRQEKPDGMATNAYVLTDSDIESGNKTLPWTDFSTYKYVKLFVKADYGVVVKRIDLSV